MAIKIQEPTLFLRVDKKKKDGRMPIYIRVQRIDGKEPKFPLGISCLPEKWDKAGKHILDNDGSDILLQEELNRIKKAIRSAEIDEIEITVDILREIVSRKEEKANKPENQSFYYYFEEYISKKKNIGEMGESTVKTYHTTIRALKEFRSEIRIKDISTKLLDDFDKFLIKRGQENNHGDVKGSRHNRSKHIKAIIRHIENLKIPIKNPYRTLDLSIPKYIVNKTFIEIDELCRMHELINKLEVTSIERRVLLMYLFSCACGIRISDILVLKWGNLDVDLDPWILSFDAKKKKKHVDVPMFPLALEILQYAPEGNLDNVYKEKPIFPWFCQKQENIINETLRELAKIAKIEKHLTFHSSRRTFATIAIAQGVSIETLKNYMGHSSIRTTERYTKWSPKLAEHSANKINLFDLKTLLKKKKR